MKKLILVTIITALLSGCAIPGIDTKRGEVKSKVLIVESPYHYIWTSIPGTNGNLPEWSVIELTPPIAMKAVK